MSAAFTTRNCCASVFAAAIVALMIAAAVAPWYHFEQSFDFKQPGSSTATGSAGASLTASTSQLNSTKIYYDLNGVKTTVSVGGTVRASTFQNYPSGNSLRDVTKTSQAFVLIALLSGFVLLTLLFTFFFDRIRNKLIFAIGMTLTRLIAVAFAALILVSVIIAFLVYIGVVKAFKDDSQNCVDGPCRKFVDSSSTDRTATTTVNGATVTGTVTETLAWGPIEGWYITLATTLPAIILVLVVVINKFPLPIDSEASSGEAL